MNKPPDSALDSDAYNQQIRSNTIDRLQRDRSEYLVAVALHHSSVASIAYDMTRMARHRPWNKAQTDAMEAMAAEIEESHIKTFGSPTVEPGATQ